MKQMLVDVQNTIVKSADGGEKKLRIHGGATGSSEGGQIELHTAADYDTTYAFYRIDAYQDDLRIGRTGTTDITLLPNMLSKNLLLTYMSGIKFFLSSSSPFSPSYASIFSL